MNNKFVRSLSVFFLLVLACTARGQDTPFNRPVELPARLILKNLAPRSSEPMYYRLPQIIERRLKNGLTLIMVPNYHSPSFDLTLCIDATSLSDPPDRTGVAEATAALMLQGTRTRSAEEISRAFANQKLDFVNSFGYGARWRRLSLNGLVETLESGLEIVADLVLNPAFPANEIERWKANRIAWWRQSWSRRNTVIYERFTEMLYQSDRRGIASAPPDVVARLTREDILEFHQARYRPGTSRLAIVGNFDPERVTRMVEKYFGAWTPGAAEWPRVEINPPLPRSRVRIINYPQSDETQLIIGNLAVHRFDDDYLAFALLNQILGGRPYGWDPASKYDAAAAPSRLLARFAERKGVRRVPLTDLSALKYLQHFAVVTTTDAEHVQSTLDGILAEFRSLQDGNISAEELENAKRAMITDLVSRLEGSYWLCHQVLEYDLLPRGYWDNYATMLSRISVEDIQRVARKYLPTSNVQILALGPAEKLSQSLLRYGPVEKFDPETAESN